MNYLLIVIYSLFGFFFFNYLFRKYHFLIDKKILPHKSFTSSAETPLIGGLIVMLYLIIFNDDSKFIFFCFLIFSLGFFSDLLVLKKPLTKFMFQIIIVLSFLFFNDLKILSTKIFFLDYFLDNKIFSILFTLFCLLILINGANFIDGVNTLLCGYYLLVLIAIFYISSNNIIFNLNIIDLREFLLILFMLFLFNFFSKLYLGDSGAFLISFIVGYYLINIANNNPIISPLFIVLLLWYPAFENFFSIFRKFYNKSHPSNPDNFHLHQLLFIFLKKRLNINTNFINSLTGNVINFFNFITFCFGINFFSSTKYLIFLVFVNILFYLLTYYLLTKNLKNNT
jgi:UDP-N-acetylmuramyl pentapeptide phosphotransferase/UDP-N-acetylglucosamine-1-phosphate transferase